MAGATVRFEARLPELGGKGCSSLGVGVAFCGWNGSLSVSFSLGLGLDGDAFVCLGGGDADGDSVGDS